VPQPQMSAQADDFIERDLSRRKVNRTNPVFI